MIPIIFGEKKIFGAFLVYYFGAPEQWIKKTQTFYWFSDSLLSKCKI
jgi:hypothetical protein